MALGCRCCARGHRCCAWGSGRVIVRSSARSEDGAAGQSQAGRYDSVPGISGTAAIAQAIERVIASFDGARTDADQVFVQPLLDAVAMAGVAFSRAPSGGPYYIVNYDRRSGRTDGVTSGTDADNLETFYCAKSRQECPPALAPVIALLRELEAPRLRGARCGVCDRLGRAALLAAGAPAHGRRRHRQRRGN